MKIAMISSDGINVDLHLGKGATAYIYESDENFKFLELRNIPINLNEKHQSSIVIDNLDDCKVIIAQDFGFKAKVYANSKNIILFKSDGDISQVFKDFMNWYEVMKD